MEEHQVEMPRLLVLNRGEKHIRFALANQQTGEEIWAFSLHQVEARQLSQLILELLGSPVASRTLVEGAYVENVKTMGSGTNVKG